MAHAGVESEQPGKRPPAPPPLDLVQDFVNSWDREAGVERFDTPRNLARWLRARGLIGSGDKVTPEDVRAAVELREAIRALLLEHNGEPASDDLHAAFARFAAASPLVARFDERGKIVLAPAQRGVAGAWARIFAAIAEAGATDAWSRLKACRSDVCRWAFYDRSKNRSSHWCTMEICGARTKMRRYRKQRHAAGVR
jgi:predicted RNA-binding Zn ribbon-like protein